MKFTQNVVTLPKEVVDAYLDALMATVDPILKEEDVPACVLQDLIYAAGAAVRKSIVIKNLKALEEAGLFNGVTCVDYPGFTWTLGLKRLYAVNVFSLSLLRTLALDLAVGTRTLDDYLNYLEVCSKIELESGVHTALKDAPEAMQRRLEGVIGSITQANTKYMLGVTVENVLRLFKNVKDNLEMQVDDGPLANLEDDMSLLMPEAVIEM